MHVCLTIPCYYETIQQLMSLFYGWFQQWLYMHVYTENGHQARITQPQLPN